MGQKYPEKPVDPWRSREDINAIRTYLRSNTRYGDMYAFLITCGCNTGLRASDLRNLQYGDFNGTHIDVVEQKTGVRRHIYINEKLRQEFEKIKSKWVFVADNTYIFAAQGKRYGIETKHIHKVIKRTCRALSIKGNYGSHSMRKTFAYHIYSKVPHITYLRRVLGHSSTQVTSYYVDGVNSSKNPPNETRDNEMCVGCKKHISRCRECGLHDEVIKLLNL